MDEQVMARMAEILANTEFLDGENRYDFPKIIDELTLVCDSKILFNKVLHITNKEIEIEKSMARSTAISLLFVLDGNRAKSSMLRYYLTPNGTDPVWIVQMSAMSGSAQAARFLETLMCFEDNEELRAEIIASLEYCGDEKSIDLLEAFVKWETDYSWDGVEIKSLARGSIEAIKLRLL